MPSTTTYQAIKLKPLPVIQLPTTIGLGLELTPPADEDAEGDGDTENPSEMVHSLGSFDTDHHPGTAGIGNRSGSNSVIGSGWSMIAGDNLYTKLVEDEDMFQFSPSRRTFSSTTLDDTDMYDGYPFTPASPISMPRSFGFGGSGSSAGEAGFVLAPAELISVRDDALRQLYGASAMGGGGMDSDWYGSDF